MSLEVNLPNQAIHNQTSKPGFLTKLVTPLVLGTAVAFGGQAIADQPQPDNAQPVQNEPAPEEPASPPVSRNLYGPGFGFGYLTGVIIEKILRSRSEKRLTEEIYQLQKDLSLSKFQLQTKSIEEPNSSNPSS